MRKAAISPDALFKTIDWKLLREQKTALLDLLADFADAGIPEEVPALDGLVHLIDGIQDCAYNCGYGTEDEIFGEKAE